MAADKNRSSLSPGFPSARTHIDVDTLLGPEMKSTGEVMGINAAFGPAFAKAQLGAGQNLPTSGTVFISVEDSDKPKTLQVAQIFHDTGFAILGTKGMAAFLLHHHIPAREIHKVSSGRPHVVDAIINREIHFIVNTGTGSETQRDGYQIRRAALKFSIPYAPTIAGALAMAHGVAAPGQRAGHRQAHQGIPPLTALGNSRIIAVSEFV